MTEQERFIRHWSQSQATVATYISSLAPDFATAEDVLQEVAVIALRKFSQYDRERPFLVWVLGIAKREILSVRRGHARSFSDRNSGLAEAFAEAAVELKDELDTRTQVLRNCLKKVDGRAAQMLKLRYEESLKPQQIAERLGIAVGAVRTRLSRVRSALRDCISRGMGGPGE